MNGNESKVIKLLIVALILLTFFVIGLSILFAIAFRDVQDSIHDNKKDSDVVAAIKSIRVINGQNGMDGLSVQGPRGMNGVDSVSTTTIIQQPVKGDKGDKGDPAPVIRIPEFDGLGHWRLVGDEDWLPLFAPPEEM